MNKELKSLNEKFSNLSTTHFCDSSDKVRILSPNIRAINNNVNFLGYSYTVNTKGDLLPVIEAIDCAPEGAVLIINTNNSPHAVFGEIFANCAQNRGFSGIIIDGLCRDIAHLKILNIPIFAKGFSPRAGTKCHVGENGGEINCGDIKIKTNELVFSDDSGIIVLSESELSELLPKAITIQEKEEEALRKIKFGKTICQILNYEEHKSNIINQKESRLIWI